VKERIEEFTERDVYKKYLRFRHEYDIRYAGEGEDRNRFYFWTISPYYSYRYFSYAMSIPENRKGKSEGIARIAYKGGLQQGQGMHGTSRVGIAYATHARPAEFYKFRHPNRSYQRFYGWCLSRQQLRGQFPHTCQAETLQEFFSCREAQSAVHNHSTKTTTEKLMNDHLLPASDSGPTPRRAKSDFLSVRCEAGPS
jgi:hypothetical protein